jgi:beta-xylosidase
MVKQIFITFFFIFICFWGKAERDNIESKTSPCARNNLKFNYDLLANQQAEVSYNCTDDFNLPILRSSWQTIMDEDYWTLKERPGFLRVKANKVEDSQDVFLSKTFSQKISKNTIGVAITYLDLSQLNNETRAGLYVKGEHNNMIGVQMDSGLKKIFVSINNTLEYGIEIENDAVIFRLNFDVDNAWFEYSFDGVDFTKIGESFLINTKPLIHDLIGIYCYSRVAEESFADFDWFYFDTKYDTALKYAENR